MNLIHWLKDNAIQLLTALILVTFGYANFTKDVEANASDLVKLEKRVDKYEEKLDKAIMLLERIDERTSK
jgi:tRNA A-37 threonylcarbamoyl transferase component Bud32